MALNIWYYVLLGILGDLVVWAFHTCKRRTLESGLRMSPGGCISGSACSIRSVEHGCILVYHKLLFGPSHCVK